MYLKIMAGSEGLFYGYLRKAEAALEKQSSLGAFYGIRGVIDMLAQKSQEEKIIYYLKTMASENQMIMEFVMMNFDKFGIEQAEENFDEISSMLMSIRKGDIAFAIIYISDIKNKDMLKIALKEIITYWRSEEAKDLAGKLLVRLGN